MQWRLTHYFPNDDRFSHANFWFQPLYVILDGLKYGAEFQRENRHAAELPIATLTATLTNLNIDFKKSSRVKPQDFCYFAPTKSNIPISVSAANSFFSLIKDSKLPAWVLNLVPLDDLRKIKDINSKTPKFRAMIGDGIMILAPEIHDEVLSSSLVIWENANSQVQLTDIDDGSFKFTVQTNIESDFEGYSTDVGLRILASGKFSRH